MKNSGQWTEGENHGKILWGDARKKIQEIPSEVKFDLIFLDAFSPPKCPQLWSEEFLLQLGNKLTQQGRLITYSRAASIRASLKRAGLKLYSLIPEKQETSQWSIGTIATKQRLQKEECKNTERWKELSEMEEEHLSTLAAIPYRDPTGTGCVEEILNRRKMEQKKSSLPSTSSWKKRWGQQK